MTRQSREPPRLHRCDHCGKVAVWSSGWHWFTTSLDAHMVRGESRIVTCSDDCTRALLDAGVLIVTRVGLRPSTAHAIPAPGVAAGRQ